jgi:alpha-1,3-rhamnosyl/mannosyltransferase
VVAVRVIVNQLASSGKRTGVGHYSAQLLHHLRRQATPGQIHGFPGFSIRCARKVWAGVYPFLEGGSQGPPSGVWSPLRPLPIWRQASLRALRGLGRTLMARQFRKLFARKDYALYHEPNFLPLAIDVPTVATFHDLSVLLHPEWHPRDRIYQFERHLPAALAQCRHLLTVSDFSRREVIQTLNVPARRVTRVYNGIRAGLRPVPDVQVRRVLRRLGLPPRYLLYLGTLEPRKNVCRLLQAYCALPDPVRRRWPLVLVGGWGWRFLEIADYLHREARHRGVIHFGYVAEKYLAAVYSGARALLYPSLYEGFGLPPLEMMACGGAVLTSTAGALVETAGSHAHQIDPEDVGAWRDAMARVVADDDWWRSLRRGVVGAVGRYTWEDCARQTLRVYRSVYAECYPNAASGGLSERLPLAA